ncbi:MAG: hypothetical protein WDZ75_01020 [Candidatus Paceibacterota bacterium]
MITVDPPHEKGNKENSSIQRNILSKFWFRLRFFVLRAAANMRMNRLIGDISMYILLTKDTDDRLPRVKSARDIARAVNCSNSIELKSALQSLMGWGNVSCFRIDPEDFDRIVQDNEVFFLDYYKLGRTAPYWIFESLRAVEVHDLEDVPSHEFWKLSFAYT